MCVCVCDIGSACVCVPKIIFVDAKVCGEGGSVRWDRFELMSERLAQAATAHERSEEKEEECSSFFSPSESLHILQIVGWLV